MSIKTTGHTIAALTLVTLITAATCTAADWPWWRGPRHDGVSTESGWSKDWPESGPPLLWKASVGRGYSTFAVANGKAYTLGNADDKDTVFCFDAQNGKIIWKYSYPEELDAKWYPGGTLASPAVADSKVYTISKNGKAFCFNADDGAVIWKKDLIQDLKIERTTWGYAGSPLIIDNMVIFNAGKAGLALNKETGEKIWLSTTDPGGYATAVPFEMDGKKCIAYFGFQEILGIEPATGKVLWRYSWKTQHDVNAADPIISGDNIFISSGYGTGCALLKLEKIGDTRQPRLVWENKNMRNKMNACVLYDGYIYGVDEGGHLRCLDMKTGEKLWEQKGFGQGSLSIADGKLLVMGEDGTLVVAETSPDGYKVLSQAKVLPAKAWTVPVLANGKIFVRDEEGNTACLDVSM